MAGVQEATPTGVEVMVLQVVVTNDALVPGVQLDTAVGPVALTEQLIPTQPFPAVAVCGVQADTATVTLL